MFPYARHVLFIAALLAAAGARADVYQCLDAAGKMLLTDSVCPSGYKTNLVVSDPEPRAVAAAPQPQAGEARAAEDAVARRVLKAEAESDLLREQLELERLRTQLARERLEAIENDLAGLDQQTFYGGVAVPFFAGHKPRFHGKPGLKDGRGRIDGKTRVISRPPRNCGTFGCTPTITHAPWDDMRGVQRRGRPLVR